MQKDLLAYIRNGQELTLQQKLQLVVYLSLPSIMAQLTSTLMSYIDASMVGRLGNNASAAIGLVASSTWFFSALSISLASGYSIQVAQYIGACEYKKAAEVLKHSYIVVLGASLAIGLVGVLVSGPLPAWLDGDEIIRADASNYFRIFALSVPLIAFNRLAASMLQCSGDMKTPGILNSLMCVLDVIMNVFFIYVAGLGVIGAALGTASAELIVAGMMFYALQYKTPILHEGDGEGFVWNPFYVRKAFQIAIPLALDRLVTNGAYIVTTKIAAPLGVTAVAANSFAVTAEGLCYMPGFGIADAAVTLVGQSVGAGRKDVTWSFAKITVIFGMLVMTVSGTLLYVFAPFLIGIMSPDAEICALGARVLRIEAFAEPLYAASIVCTGVLRGAGNTKVNSILNMISMWCVRIPLSLLFVKSMGLIGIWVAMALELSFRGILFLVRLLRRRWMTDTVIA